MFQTLASTLLVGLKLWQHKEAHKYIDKTLELKRRYYEEVNKPSDKRNDAVLDNLEFELRILAGAFSAGVETKDT